jgi:hypothetical protein
MVSPVAANPNLDWLDDSVGHANCQSHIHRRLAVSTACRVDRSVVAEALR